MKPPLTVNDHHPVENAGGSLNERWGRAKSAESELGEQPDNT
jgi:hypothetical protein